ncbi:MarR family winged helix-turn-helix transcriptional regulator [Puniceibacterium confluentis]|uniref:MarR family winged helix-turn-helix transcriptional regulator n=1 Tax=Puniceibacterium confluentis TaxID=1958944 RepID=UPI0011B63730|nr:MarR family transcriptional regulator [Puniceibacterium confluentis]
MPRNIDPDTLGFLLNDLARLMRSTFEHEIEAAAIPVTPSEARVLAHMSRCGAVQQTQLACILGVAPMSLSAFIDRLEAGGLVARRPDPSDRRAKLVTLTPAAEPVLDQIAQAGARARACATSGIDAAELDRFRKTACRIRDSLDLARAGRAARSRKLTA